MQSQTQFNTITTFLEPETILSLFLISWLVMLGLGSLLGARGMAVGLAYHQSCEDAKADKSIAKLSDECAKSKVKDMKHMEDLAEKDGQIAQKVAALKEAEKEIKLLWDGTNGTDGLHHLREQLKTYQEGNAYQQYQQDLSFGNRTNNQLMERITKLESVLEYENEKNDILSLAQVEYQNEIKGYRFQLLPAPPNLLELLTSSTPSVETAVAIVIPAQTVASTLTLQPAIMVYEETPIEPILPLSQPVAALITQQLPPQLPPNFHHHLSRSQKLDDIQGILTKSMHDHGILEQTKQRASPNDVRKAIKYDLPELIQKSILYQTSLSKVHNTLDNLQLDTNTGYVALFPEEAAKSGQISPQTYLRAITGKVRNLQGEIENLRNAPAVTIQPPTPSTAPTLDQIAPSPAVPTTFFNISAADPTLVDPSNTVISSSFNLSTPASPAVDLASSNTPVFAASLPSEEILAKKNSSYQQKHFNIHNRLVRACRDIMREVSHSGICEDSEWKVVDQKEGRIYSDRYLFGYHTSYDEVIRVGKRFEQLHDHIGNFDVRIILPFSDAFTRKLAKWEKLKVDWVEFEGMDFANYELIPAGQDGVESTSAVATSAKSRTQKNTGVTTKPKPKPKQTFLSHLQD